MDSLFPEQSIDGVIRSIRALWRLWSSKHAQSFGSLHRFLAYPLCSLLTEYSPAVGSQSTPLMTMVKACPQVRPLTLRRVRATKTCGNNRYILVPGMCPLALLQCDLARRAHGSHNNKVFGTSRLCLTLSSMIPATRTYLCGCTALCRTVLQKHCPWGCAGLVGRLRTVCRQTGVFGLNSAWACFDLQSR